MKSLRYKFAYSHIISAICLSLLLSACSSGSAEKTAPQASLVTPQGPVQGVTTDTDGIYNFKGLPFAAPPIGALRWAPPAPAPKWQETYLANKFGNRCMQPSSEDGFLDRLIAGHGLGKVKQFLINRYTASQTPTPMSEDCLYLNVRSANLKVGAVKQPVMVWIHGGAHHFGSSDFSYYQSNGLVKQGVVLVTINYRLGAFGYMSHPALSADNPRGVSGNYGTLDQIAALKWVQDNISAYGGDPDNVTIFGESAGAWSVTEMMATPLAKGLFHKAIAQSGSSAYHMIQMDDDSSPYDGQGWPSGYDKGIVTANALGLDNPSAADLRAIDAETILEQTPPDAYDAFHHQRDGYVFPKNVGLAFRDGDINAVPYLTGYNADEGTLFFSDDPQPSVWIEDLEPGTKAEIGAKLSKAFPTQAEKLIQLYALDKEFHKGGEQMMGDEIFGTNIVYSAKQVEAAGQPSYIYHFSRIPPSKTQTIGAFHAAEIPFVFDSNVDILGLSDDDKKLTYHMAHYWANFAKTANPNISEIGKDPDAALPNWPEYKGQNWMHFSGNTKRPIAKIDTNLRAEKLKALDEGLQLKLRALAASGQHHKNQLAAPQNNQSRSALAVTGPSNPN